MKSLLIALSLIIGLNVQDLDAKVLIGKIDIQSVMNQITQGKKANKKLKKEFDKKQKELKTKEEGIKKMQEGFQKQSLVMSEEAKRKKDREIKAKIVELQRKSVEYQKIITDMEKKLKAPILDRLKGVVAAVSKKEGLAVTFEVRSAPVVYVENEVDITSKVVAAFNKKFPK